MWIGAWWQRHGINVIPNLHYSTPDSWEFMFDGLPKNSAISISTVGINRDKYTWNLMKKAVSEMIDRIDPVTILWRGIIPEEFVFENIIKLNDQGDLHFKQRHTNSKKRGDQNG